MAEAVLAERANASAPAVDLEGTGPESTSGSARDTATVVRELFAHAKSSVLIAGYALTTAERSSSLCIGAMAAHSIDVSLFLEIILAGRAECIPDHGAEWVNRFLLEKRRFSTHPTIYHDPQMPTKRTASMTILQGEAAMDGTERIYNLFIYVDGDTVAELGVARHDASGTDAEKRALLESLVDSDCRSARRVQLVHPVDRREFEMMMRLSVQDTLFQDLPIEDALWLITPVVNGEPKLRPPEDPADERGETVDYLQKYAAGGRLDVGQLLNDDHFVPIKLLFNAGHYISAAKLLMSFIDTIAYVEFGDIPGDCIFARWLDRYVDLAPIGITSRELWEYRNGLLHMSNLASRAVLSGKVARLIMYVGPLPESSRQNSPQEKYFNLMGMIRGIWGGLADWVSSFSGDRAKALEFVDRYDLIVSDARSARIEANSEQP